MKPSVEEMRLALRDLKIALEMSFIEDDGHFVSYETNGTSRVIPVAVMALVKIRNPNESALREDGDGDGRS